MRTEDPFIELHELGWINCPECDESGVYVTESAHSGAAVLGCDDCGKSVRIGPFGDVRGITQ